MAKLRVLDLFSGIGGFSLGLERASLPGAKYDGFETVAFCEIEEFPRKVLAKHWPDVFCYEDVRELTATKLAADGIAVDAICGGFPCQDISFAGKGAGLAGERSGLFYEIARLVGELGPRFVILENVGALLSRGLDAVLGTLASFGYDAEWHCIPASHVGAPHRRDRVWIMAYPASERCGEAREYSERPAQRSARSGEVLADAINDGLQRIRFTREGERKGVAFAREKTSRGVSDCFAIGSSWDAEPDVGRVADGVPSRAHRLRALGNAVVPQIPELIGNAILQSLDNPTRQLAQCDALSASVSVDVLSHEPLITAEAR